MNEDFRPLAGAVRQEIERAIGAEHLCTTPEDLDRYSRCTIPWRSRCAAVVFPDGSAQVSALLRICGAHRIPVWPYSTGRNWGYGTTLATEDGAVIMILSRMNRVLEVNEELAYAVIEPGVTYEGLNAYLKSHGHRLWVDCIDGTAQGSVIGNALDRGIGETPYGDHFGNLCGLEVVLPDGGILRTGGPEGSTSWNVHKWGVGPYLEGIFSQSNYGVVTRAGIWLMPRPQAYNSYVFEIRDEACLPPVLDAFRGLALSGVVNTKLHMINDFVSLTILTQRIHEAVPQKGPLGESDRAALRRKYGIAPWNCAGGIYGTRAQVRLQRALLRKALSPYGRLLFVSDWQIPHIERLIAWSWKHPLLRRLTEVGARTSLPVLESAPHVHRILQGIPTDFFVRHAYYRCRRPRPPGAVEPARDGCGLTWFAPILPFSNAQVWPYLEACRMRFAAHGFDFYIAMLLMNPRAVVCLMAILYDREDGEETEHARLLYSELLSDARARRIRPYRAGLESWPTLYADAPQLHEACERIKAALDPEGILAPGRYGIGAA
ncbi:MAG: FAD-binding oxidoreductase [Rhodocyclaceae bacterium]